MNKLDINLKKNNGSVTLFVLIAMLFFLIVSFFIYASSNNRKVSQMRELEQLKKNYEQTDEQLEEEYYEIKNKEDLIEFTPNGGEYIMPTTGKAILQTKVTVMPNDENVNIKYISYQWTTTFEKPENWSNTISNEQMVEKKDCEIGNYYLWIKVVDYNGNENIFSSSPFIVKARS